MKSKESNSALYNEALLLWISYTVELVLNHAVHSEPVKILYCSMNVRICFVKAVSYDV